jgi:hypothetical protein
MPKGQGDVSSNIAQARKLIRAEIWDLIGSLKGLKVRSGEFKWGERTTKAPKAPKGTKAPKS